jgi:hypothetical protein
VEPRLDSRVQVTVLEDDRDAIWQEVEDLASSGPHDAVFTVTRETGVIRFGDGERGRRPTEGARVRVTYFDRTRLTSDDFTVEQTYHHAHEGPKPHRNRTPAGRIAQIMPAEGWSAVLAGERLAPLVGWALLEPHVPVYRSGNEPPVPAVQSVRGLVVSAGGTVEVVDEQAPGFVGYRLDS